MKKGFSLIEMLLVIAIIGVLATISLTAYKKYSVSGKLNLAAAQLQALMEAASAYYVSGASYATSGDSQNRWPSNTQATTTMPIDFLAFIPIKVTSATIINPWGNLYTIDGQEPYKFKVSTLTPSADLATRLAGMIANAGVDPTNNKIVYAYAPVPGQRLGQGLAITDLGIAGDNAVVKQTGTCPSGTTANIQTAVNYIRADLSDVAPKGGPYERNIIASPISLISSSASKVENSSNSWKLDLTFKKVKNCSLPWYCFGIPAGGDCDYKKHCSEQTQGESPDPWNDIKVQSKVLYIIYCTPNT